MPLLSNIELRGLEQGLEQGTLQNARDSVITVLQVRLGEIPPELRENLQNIADFSLLKRFLEQAAVVNSLAEFQQLLESDNN